MGGDLGEQKSVQLDIRQVINIFHGKAFPEIVAITTLKANATDLRFLSFEGLYKLA